jgi:hypothetical protein
MSEGPAGGRSIIKLDNGLSQLTSRSKVSFAFKDIFASWLINDNLALIEFRFTHYNIRI